MIQDIVDEMVSSMEDLMSNLPTSVPTHRRITELRVGDVIVEHHNNRAKLYTIEDIYPVTGCGNCVHVLVKGIRSPWCYHKTATVAVR